MNPKRLVTYLIITFGITWSFWIINALVVKYTPLNQSDLLSIILLLLGGFGPTIAACLTLEQGFSWKKLIAFLSTYNNRGLCYLLVFALVEISFIALVSDGIRSSIPRSPMAVIICIIIFIQATLLFGGNEELGWRGIMQPILMKKLPRVLVPLLIGGIWVLWHIPLWFIEGNSHQSMSFISFAVFGIALSYWLSALFEATDSVICSMIFHGLTNTLMGVFVFNHSPLFWLLAILLTLMSIVFIQFIRNSINNQ